MAETKKSTTTAKTTARKQGPRKPKPSKDITPATSAENTSVVGDAPAGDGPDAKVSGTKDTAKQPAAATAPTTAGPQSDAPHVPATPKEAATKTHAETATSSIPATGRTRGKGGSDAVGTPSAPVPQTTIVRKGGTLSMVLGGVIAAAIGFAAAQYLGPDAWPFGNRADDNLRSEYQAALAAQQGKIGELESRLSALSDSRGDLAASADLDAISKVQLETDARIADLATSMTALQERMTAIEKRPISEGVSQEAIAAYERELQGLQDRMAEQRAEVEALAAEAEAERVAAQETSTQTTLRAAVMQVRAAIDNGGPFQTALDVLTDGGVTVPADLARLSGGVDTLAALQEDFPDLSRRALAASRGAESTGGIGSFLRQQLGARSLTAREGNDPDAILSRAEAALRDGRLDDALTELDALPAEAKAELEDWMSRARARQSARDAADALAQSVNLN